jgi:hypothetical protein
VAEIPATERILAKIELIGNGMVSPAPSSPFGTNTPIGRPPISIPVIVIDELGVTVPSGSSVSVAELLISPISSGPILKPCTSLVAVTDVPSALALIVAFDLTRATFPAASIWNPPTAVASDESVSLVAVSS